MAFTEIEIAEHMRVIEDSFWSRRRPPLHLRDQVREGQCFTGQTIELFLVRPAFKRPGEEVEEPIARVQYVHTQRAWRIFWKRGDRGSYRYQPYPQADS